MNILVTVKASLPCIAAVLVVLIDGFDIKMQCLKLLSVKTEAFKYILQCLRCLSRHLQYPVILAACILASQTQSDSVRLHQQSSFPGYLKCSFHPLLPLFPVNFTDILLVNAGISN